MLFLLTNKEQQQQQSAHLNFPAVDFLLIWAPIGLSHKFHLLWMVSFDFFGFTTLCRHEKFTSSVSSQLSQVQFGGAVQERLSTQQRHQLAQKCLTQIVHYKAHEISSQLRILWFPHRRRLSSYKNITELIVIHILFIVCNFSLKITY